MNKKGVSSVVTVVLLIVVSIVAVVLLWGALRYMLKQDFSAEELKVRLEVKKFVYDSTAKKAEVIVERVPGNARIAGYKLVFSNAEGENEVKSVSVELESLARKVSVLEFSEGFVPVNVEAFPFFLNEEGKEKVSRIGTGEVKASSGVVSGESDNGGINALCVLDQEIPGVPQSVCESQSCPINDPMAHLNLPMQRSCDECVDDGSGSQFCTFRCFNYAGCSICEGKSEVADCAGLTDFYSCQAGYEVINGESKSCLWVANMPGCIRGIQVCN